MEENDVNCTLPWIESMKEKQVNYYEHEILTCSTSDDYEFVDDIGNEFAIQASAFSHPKCLGMIKRISSIRFDVTFQ